MMHKKVKYKRKKIDIDKLLVCEPQKKHLS